VNAGANPNFVTAGGMTAVMHASAKGHVDAIAALASLGATAHYESVQIQGHGQGTVKASNTALLAAIDQGQVSWSVHYRLQGHGQVSWSVH
jgi:ankyrin repeat protein